MLDADDGATDDDIAKMVEGAILSGIDVSWWETGEEHSGRSEKKGADI